MSRFLRTLEQSGYRQFYLAFGDANFRKQDWSLGAKGLPNPLSDFVQLFLLQQPVVRRKLRAYLEPDLLDELLDCGILRQEGQHVASNSFFLIYCRSAAVFCQMAMHPMAYFGDDSVALATLQSPVPDGRVLDLCCGAGIQSFVAAAYAAKVTGVEVQRQTWRIAQLNCRLNNLSRRVRFVCKPIEEFASDNGEGYDRILFNPPLIPMVQGYKFPLAGNGGADGLELTSLIIKLYSGRLAPSGSFEFIGTGLGRQNRPSVCNQLLALARRYQLTGRIHLLSRHPIRAFAPVFESAVSLLARANNLELALARQKLLAHFQKLGQDSYWMFFASLHRRAGAHDNRISIIDLTKSFWGAWFV